MPGLKHILHVKEDQRRWEIVSKGADGVGDEKDDEGPVSRDIPQAPSQAGSAWRRVPMSFPDGKHAPPAKRNH